eukprot:CAMPEP_0206436518 /NCGR_PEP_ID=MMETSP0324_2-20121206/10524_1 /ASSEMBLY_ACC=CAM_ASM_000836 /TAXON_ID=2866 /ORGANISM="Crypthecodinium cohnii, Strain Seligo" /LENGTH=52 /DNA_ID=CAMNT_0053903685 /DNA_START=149 /DNA_END=307 /DNA_ORIENTATION=-
MTTIALEATATDESEDTYILHWHTFRGVVGAHHWAATNAHGHIGRPDLGSLW